MFVVFIFGCGTTHVMDVWTVVYPAYWLAGIVKAITAVASIATAIALIRLIPQALALDSEEKFQALFESAPDAMVMLGADGRIALVSAQTEKLFGYARGELLGREIEVLVPPRFRAHHPALRAEYFAAPRPRPMGTGLDLAGLRRDGSEFAAEISLSPIHTQQGTLVTAAIRDISARKRLEEENVRRLLEASRLKSEFLANMSHELRTPLNAMIGFASFIQSAKAGPVTDAQKEYLGDILVSSRHLLQLINDILDFAKIEAGKMDFHPEPIELAPLVEEVRDSMRMLAAEKNIALSFEVEREMTATLDRAKLKQVLYNYLSNAIKFTPDGGCVAVRVAPEPHDRFRIEVEDTGIGIAAADLPLLFSDFRQLDIGSAKKYPGTGLGLSLTKRIVEAQGGTIGVRSEPGAGSTFWAILPKVAIEATARVAKPLPAIAIEPGPAVLVVEADPRQRGWLSQILREADYDVQAVATGAAALSLCRHRAFSAITLDVLLPEVSGLDILQRIRAIELNKTVPVVAVTVASEGRASATFVIHDFMINPPDRMVMGALRRAALSVESGPILAIDDDAHSLALKAATLTRLGYYPICCDNRADALAAITTRTPPAAIVLNLLMPAMEGFEILDQIRRTSIARTIPIIAWSSRELREAERLQLRTAAQSVTLRNQSSTAEMLEELRPYIAHPKRSRSDRSQAA
ncbi:MAG TPA: ATP-binding protein, partial [Candidatus Binataceae bacterium]|nr:ATP-binding protein [Candidatus Binataceae bacterium]